MKHTGSRARGVVVGILVAALVFAGCGSEGDDQQLQPPEEGSGQLEPTPDDELDPAGLETDAPVDTREAAGFDEVFVAGEHMEVWALEIVAGIDEYVGLPGDPHTEAARVLATWDGLWRADVVFTAYATDAEITGSQESFLAAQDTMGRVREALREHYLHLFNEDVAHRFEELYTEFQLNIIRYAQAVATDDESAKQKAFEALEQFVEEYVDFIVDITNDQVEQEKLKQHLDELIKKLTDTITAQRRGGTDWFAELKPAVDVTKHIAEVIVHGIAKHLTLDGDVTSEAATYRAELSGRMAEAAWFFGYASRGLLNPDPEGPQFEHARRLVDENTKELREAWAEHLGEDTALELADLWTHHVELLVAYAEAVREDDQQQRDAVEEELAAWASAFAEVLSEATNGALDETVMEREAEKHYRTVIDVIVAQHEFLTGPTT